MTETEIPQRVKLAGGHFVPEFPDECEPHTPCPSGYLARDEWFEKMTETHVQRQCTGCGLWAIWEPKTPDGGTGQETAEENDG